MGENDTHQLREMASRLGAMLNAEGKQEREAWLKLRGKLVEFATDLSIADPNMTTAIASKAKEAIGSLDLCHPEAEALLVQMMRTFGRIGAENGGGSKAVMLKDLIVLVADELSMIPLCDSGYKPMIHGAMLDEDNIDEMVSDWLSSPSTPYGVVSIVGAQSSGKSYLLNQLFGANFPVMKKAKGGWKQTTQGILMSRCIGPSLLILDVEGFDGRERGEDKQFENQAALFALTVSNLMMVNISEQDIGRDDGGGKTLFTTIFQERTKLPEGLTKMLVVLRRCDEETTSDVLDDVIENMKKMWTSVHGKANGQVFKFEDYIEVEVVALPDKNMPDFQTKVTQLRRVISESTLGNNEGGQVPASIFTCSCKSYWDKIKQNKRLDLPSIKVAFTKIYCQKIAKEALISLDSHKELEAQRSPEDFKKLSDTLLGNIIDKYNTETVMYDEDLRKEERENMIKQIMVIHLDYARKLIQEMRQRTFDQFKSEVVANYDVKMEEYRVRFITLCEDLKAFDVEYFHNMCAELQKELYLYTNYKMIELKNSEFISSTRADLYNLVAKQEERAQKEYRTEDLYRKINVGMTSANLGMTGMNLGFKVAPHIPPEVAKTVGASIDSSTKEVHDVATTVGESIDSSIKEVHDVATTVGEYIPSITEVHDVVQNVVEAAPSIASAIFDVVSTIAKFM